MVDLDKMKIKFNYSNKYLIKGTNCQNLLAV